MSQNSDKQPYSAHISFNDIERTFAPVDTGGVFSYDDVTAIRYVEEHGTMGRGGIARAFSTSFIDDRRGVFIASEMMKIKIELKDRREILITFLKTPVKSNTFMYRMLKEQADSVLAKLNEIRPQSEADQTYDYTSELRKLKRLVDEGIISEAEFQLKKKQILGI